jgi:hypothetical protein
MLVRDRKRAGEATAVAVVIKGDDTLKTVSSNSRDCSNVETQCRDSLLGSETRPRRGLGDEGNGVEDVGDDEERATLTMSRRTCSEEELCKAPM